MGSFNRKSITDENVSVSVGDGLYDIKYDRVLWISRIDESGVTVEPVTDYKTAEQIGWPPGGQSRMVTAGTTFAPTEFIALIDSGRFEVAPR